MNKKGVTPHKNGCIFIVWAPNADKVFLIGTFNGWDKTKHPMIQDSDGMWSIDIPEAKIGDEYRYRIISF